MLLRRKNDVLQLKRIEKILRRNSLLPLDVLKIKRQTNPEAFKGRGFLRILQDEGLG